VAYWLYFFEKKEDKMTNIIKRNNASRQPESFGSVVDQVFQKSLNQFFNDDFWGFNGSLTRNQVPVNIMETEKSYELELIAPGLNKKDIKLNVEDNLMTISAQQSEENKQEDKNTGWLRQEYRMNAFTRTFNLDDSVDSEKITARYEDGVLYLSLPKKEGPGKMTRTINVE
jgi:HSP20 family protein